LLTPSSSCLFSDRVSSEPFYTCHPSMREGSIDGFWQRPTHVSGAVYLGSLRTLEGGNAKALAANGFRRVILLCNADAVSSSFGLLHRNRVVA
jgi:hypothetical protein